MVNYLLSRHVMDFAKKSGTFDPASRQRRLTPMNICPKWIESFCSKSDRVGAYSDGVLEEAGGNNDKYRQSSHEGSA